MYGKFIILGSILVTLTAQATEEIPTTKRSKIFFSKLLEDLKQVQHKYKENSHTDTKPIKIAILGDQGFNERTRKILEMVKKEGSELLIINGDFDCTDSPKKWKDIHAKILGKDFPIIPVAGNHDIKKWDEYKKVIKEWESNPKLSCSGEAGEQTICSYKGIKIVSTTPHLFKKYNHTKYIHEAFKSDNTNWKICSWHENMTDMQTGKKGNATGWGVYQECLNNGALITTGHEHAYARTYLLSNIKDKTIANYNSIMSLERGQTVVALSGVGGKTARPQLHDGYWWANRQNRDTGLVGGALFCTFRVDNEPDKAECYFKDIEQGILDNFILWNNSNL